MSGADITAFMPRDLVDMLEDACALIRRDGFADASGLAAIAVVALGSAVGEWARGLVAAPGREELISTVNRHIRDQLNAAERAQ